ncbi:MAG: ISL3 family transposase [Candidatus Aerophobetes bacterium]|nr:ISL3 family transposase [Candidatus Aerophobetes bacterium]
MPSVRFDTALTEKEEDSTEIHLLRKSSYSFICSSCGQRTSFTYGSTRVRIRDLSIFEFKSYLVLDKYRVKCPNCGVKVEKLDFADIYSRCTDRFEEYVARLCQITSVKQVADLLEMDWKTVKDIDKKYLKREFAIPDYDDLRILGVDEISSKKGHHYFTVVTNMEKTKVIWVGKKRKKETLDSFFKELGPDRCKKIQAVAIDMWDPFIASIREYLPQAEIVFDKFHVINKYSKVIDKVRNAEYKKATESDRDIIKGTKYVLLKNPENLEMKEKEKLTRLLDLNENINMSYILKDDLKILWEYIDAEGAEKFLNSWIERARETDIRALKDFTKTLENYKYGLLNHANYPINSGKIEGMNNKIKVIKRVAYGFHDDEYFILKIKQGCS